jgi:hypothetical protein
MQRISVGSISMKLREVGGITPPGMARMKALRSNGEGNIVSELACSR